MKKSIISIAFIIICCLSACQVATVPSETQSAVISEEHTETPSPVPTETVTPTPDPTETPTPTPTPVQEQETEPVEEQVEEPEAEIIEESPEDELSARTTALDKTMYATQACNVRAGDGTNFEKTGSLTFAQEVKVTGQSSEGWYRIDLGNGNQGYVSRKLLSDNKPSAQKQQSSSGGGSAAQTAPAQSSGGSEYGSRMKRNVTPDIVIDGNMFTTGDGTF